jgi:hypothetical protein
MEVANPERVDFRDTSDELLHANVRRSLDSSGYRALAALECEAKRGVITLRGVLPSFYLKQVVQTLILRIENVTAIDDRIEVTR